MTVPTPVPLPVQLALDDLGAGVQFVDALEALGYRVTWSRTDRSMPPPGGGARPPIAVGLDGDGDAVDLPACVAAWRQLTPPPACLIIGDSLQAREVAERCNATQVPSGATRDQLGELFESAIRYRFMAELSVSFAVLALGLQPGKASGDDLAVMIVGHARSVGIEDVRQALRPHISSYVTVTERVALLREHRALEIPEVDLTGLLDGTVTVRSAIDARVMDPEAAARALWALACVGAIEFTAEPPDMSTPGRRAVSVLREHLRRRMALFRKGKASYFDVLEVSLDATSEEVSRAVWQLATRYSPRALTAHDLGDLTAVGEALWRQVEKAQAMLSTAAQRERYELQLRSRGIDLRRRQAELGIDPASADNDFETGQRDLAEGEVFKALSRFAAAARRSPGRTDYEAYLAWARYRADVQRGMDKAATAARERLAAEQACAGRQPRPRASLALGLLCAAAGDAEAARWHLREALALEPGLAHARQLLDRIS